MGVTMYGDDTAGATCVGGCRLDQPVGHLDGQAPVEVLDPGRSTIFSIRFPGTFCRRQPTRLEVRVPGDDHPLRVAPRVCAQSPVEVSAFGTTAHAWAG